MSIAPQDSIYYYSNLFYNTNPYSWAYFGVVIAFGFKSLELLGAYL